MLINFIFSSHLAGEYVGHYRSTFDALKGRQCASAADRDKVPDNAAEDLVPNATYRRRRSCFIPAKVDCYELNNIRVGKRMGWQTKGEVCKMLCVYVVRVTTNDFLAL